MMSYNNLIENILSNLPNSIYWKDLNGVYLGANIQAAQMVGLASVNDLIGKTDYDLTSKINADKFRENDLIVLNTGKELSVEEISVSKDGAELIQLSTKKPIKESNGDIVGIMGVTIDITELKKKEKMLWDQSQSLKEALSAKKRFFNMLSHEIRTPIHIIDSIAEELYQNLDRFSEQESKSFLGTLLQNSTRAKKLVEGLLEMAKSTQQQEYYSFEKKNLVDAIYDTISEFANIAKISFNTKSEKVICNIDTFKIGQVIRNLLDNAIKYGDSDSIVIELIKSLPKQNVTIKVRNKGIGILEQEYQKIFEPFFRGSNAQTFFKGSGLGLSICKEIIIGHKGTIWIENEDFGVTSVNFTIPYIE